MRTLVVIVVVLALGLGAAGWVISDEVRTEILDLSDFEPTRPVEVIEVSAREIELGWLDVGETKLARDEVAGVVWEDGYGQVTGYLGRDGGTVRRVFRALRGGLPDDGERVGIDEYVWPDDPGVLGLEFTEEVIEGPLGPMPAWSIPATDDGPWVVLVHGRNDRGRLEMLRLVPFLHAAGYNVVVPTYRNDEGAPQVENRRVAFGATEWTDLAAVMDWVDSRATSDVSIIGYSMGAAITLSWMVHEPERAGDLLAVVLDSPTTDIERTIKLHIGARELPIPLLNVTVPGIVADAAILIAELRFDVDFSEYDYIARAGDLPSVPILVLHGTEDVTIPIETSRSFADAAVRARVVELFGGHTRMWNVDPVIYEAQVLQFLDRYR